MKGNTSSHMTVLMQFLLSESLGWDSSSFKSGLTPLELGSFCAGGHFSAAD